MILDLIINEGLTGVLFCIAFYGPFIIAVICFHRIFLKGKNEVSQFNADIRNDNIQIISMTEYEFVVVGKYREYNFATDSNSSFVKIVYKNKCLNKKITRTVIRGVDKTIKKGDIYPFFEIKYKHPDGRITIDYKYPSLAETENYERYLESLK